MERLRPGWAVKAIVVIMMTSILFRCVSATNHSVGDSTGWDLASDLRAWSAATTFHVGDSLVFAYTPLHDVLEVDQSDFDLCQISHPINAHRDGYTVIQLNQTGARYFICGRLGHCDMGLKLQAQVLPQLTPNATHAGSDGNGNGDGENDGNGDRDGDGSDTDQRHGGGLGRRAPPYNTNQPTPPNDHGHESPAPPSNRSKEKPEVPPAASTCKGHVEAPGSLNWWCLPLITLLLIISSRPRETLCFLFNFLHLVT